MLVPINKLNVIELTFFGVLFFIMRGYKKLKRDYKTK